VQYTIPVGNCCWQNSVWQGVWCSATNCNKYRRWKLYLYNTIGILVWVKVVKFFDINTAVPLSEGNQLHRTYLFYKHTASETSLIDQNSQFHTKHLQPLTPKSQQSRFWMSSENRNLCNTESIVRVVNCMCIHACVVEIQTQMYWNTIGRNMTTTLPVLSPICHLRLLGLSFPPGKIRCAFQKCYYFKFCLTS
jgi:hypothetical protein